jgi:hypothetical protein
MSSLAGRSFDRREQTPCVDLLVTRTESHSRCQCPRGRVSRCWRMRECAIGMERQARDRFGARAKVEVTKPVAVPDSHGAVGTSAAEARCAIGLNATSEHRPCVVR